MNDDARQHAHELAHKLIDRLGPDEIGAVLHLLEVMVDLEDEPLSEEERRDVEASREYFRQNPNDGVPFEQVVAECGLTMDQIRRSE